MNKPPAPWPFTGRFYPNGAKLVVVNIHSNWFDLCYCQDKDGQEQHVYLSTLHKKQYEKLNS